MTQNGGAKPGGVCDFERAFKVLDGVQQQVKFADGKAAFVTALNAVLFGFISSNLKLLPVAGRLPAGPSTAFWFSLVLVILYGVAALTSMVLVAVAVASRFGKEAPPCAIFFGHIKRKYGRDYARYYGDLCGMTEADWTKQASSQIVEVSAIAGWKHCLVKIALWFTLAAFGLWVGTLAAFSFLPAA